MAFVKRFNKSPIEFLDNCIIRINDSFEIPEPNVEPKEIKPLKEPKIKIAKELREQIAPQTDYESQVIVHIGFRAFGDVQRLRIWNNTFLKCRQTNTKSKMLFSDNIAKYPNWTIVEPGTHFSFTLIFEKLPKACLTFDLIEDIPEAGGFFIKGIERNNLNIYNLRLL